MHTYIKSITGSPDLFEKLAQADNKGRRDVTRFLLSFFVFTKHAYLKRHFSFLYNIAEDFSGISSSHNFYSLGWLSIHFLLVYIK